MTSFCKEGVTGELGNYFSAVSVQEELKERRQALEKEEQDTSEAAQCGSARRPHISGCRCNGLVLPELEETLGVMVQMPV